MNKQTKRITKPKETKIKEKITNKTTSKNKLIVNIKALAKMKKSPTKIPSLKISNSFSL
jgi:hypothetical protein